MWDTLSTLLFLLPGCVVVVSFPIIIIFFLRWANKSDPPPPVVRPFYTPPPPDSPYHKAYTDLISAHRDQKDAHEYVVSNWYYLYRKWSEDRRVEYAEKRMNELEPLARNGDMIAYHEWQQLKFEICQIQNARQ